MLSANGTAGWYFYVFIRTTIRSVLHRYFRVRIIGRENLDTPGPVIIAPSHRSNLDAPMLGAVPDWRVRSLSKESLFNNPVFAWIIMSLGSFPVKRGAADREAMRTAAELLTAGESLLVFPEGTRQSGNQIAEVFDGTAYLAAKGRASIVPVAIAGTEDAMPPGAKFPRRTTVTIVIGEPISAPVSEGRVKRSELAALTLRLKAALQEAFDTAVDDASSR